MTRRHQYQERVGDLARSIDQICRARGWTRVQLATELGVSEATIHRWLAGTSEPLPAFRRAIERMQK